MVHTGLRLLSTNEPKEVNDLAAQASSLVPEIAHIPCWTYINIFFQESVSRRPKFHTMPPIIAWPQGGCRPHAESASQSRGK